MGAIKAYKCNQGHVLKGGNLYLRKNGTRECRKCSLARQRKWREDRKKKSRRKSNQTQKPN